VAWIPASIGSFHSTSPASVGALLLSVRAYVMPTPADEAPPCSETLSQISAPTMVALAFAAQVQPANGPRVIIGVSGPPVGQEIAVLVAIVSLAVVALGLALAARAGRSSTQESPR